mgnify:CR=1 FL=1
MSAFAHLNRSWINGEWVEGKSESVFTIRNKYNNEPITDVRLADRQQLNDAFAAAKAAQPAWAQTSAEERKNVLRRVGEYLEANRDAIIDNIVRETGGTLLKANIEFHLTMEQVHDAINMADELYKVREVPSGIEGKVNRIYRLPVGVITSISPFNFPFNLSMRTIAPAIALGNAVVHKPDIQVGLTGGSIIAKAFEVAGLPPGVFNVLLTDIPVIGDDLLTHPDSGLISFTGSTAVGRRVGEIAGRMLKRVALELGGNSPLVVLSDADVDRAVDAAVFGKFVHAGQICMIINRMIVHKDKYDEFVSKFVERAKQLKCGDPFDPETVIGPMINEKQINRALQLIEEGKKEGAKLVLEGQRIGNVLTPFVFADVDNSSKLAQTELFAPVAVIIKAESDDEAIELANRTDYGLSSAVFTSDLEKGTACAVRIQSGMTHINDQTVNDETVIPFGGTKASGIGRFGNPWIVEEFTTTKWISVQTKYRAYPF